MHCICKQHCILCKNLKTHLSYLYKAHKWGTSSISFLNVEKTASILFTGNPKEDVSCNFCP